jgi:hypothetical protein
MHGTNALMGERNRWSDGASHEQPSPLRYRCDHFPLLSPESADFLYRATMVTFCTSISSAGGCSYDRHFTVA